MKNSAFQLQTDSITDNQWKFLSEKKIYFGHMSVGYNILDGIKQIMARNPKIKLNTRETTDINDFANGIFSHSINGENGNPKSKVDSFVKTMDNGLAKNVDMAFFKFCYVDIDENTNIKELFDYYTSSMNALIKKYPNVKFLHVTVPLTAEGEMINVKYSIKYIIKKLIGKAKDPQRNIKRNEYNALLRKEYGKNHIIDLELFESTNADGKPYKSAKGGAQHFTMVPAYTFDGGHLNDKGSIWVADKILAQLAGSR